MHGAIMPRGVAPSNKPHEVCTWLAAVRLIAKCADMFPPVSDDTHICFLLDLLLASAVEAAGAVAECTQPRRAT